MSNHLNVLEIFDQNLESRKILCIRNITSVQKSEFLWIAVLDDEFPRETPASSLPTSLKDSIKDFVVECRHKIRFHKTRKWQISTNIFQIRKMSDNIHVKFSTSSVLLFDTWQTRGQLGTSSESIKKIMTAILAKASDPWMVWKASIFFATSVEQNAALLLLCAATVNNLMA